MRLLGLLLAIFAGSAGVVRGTAAEEALTFSVVIAKGRITPSQLEVPVGRKIRLALRNDGPGPAEFEDLELRVEKVLAPGASSIVVIHPLRPGRYRFVDEFHPDTGVMWLIAQ